MDTDRMVEIDRRIYKLEEADKDKETRLRSLEIGQALNSDRYEAIQRTLGYINNHVTWLVRLILSAIILAVLAWIFNGGLNRGNLKSIGERASERVDGANYYRRAREPASTVSSTKRNPRISVRALGKGVVTNG